MRSSEAGDAYDRLVELLQSNGARYRLIDHEPEGRTEVVSGFRGHEPEQAAKCVIVMVKLGKKSKQFARLDRSVALSSKDYAVVGQPRIERIAMEAGNA